MYLFTPRASANLHDSSEDKAYEFGKEGRVGLDALMNKDGGAPEEALEI